MKYKKFLLSVARDWVTGNINEGSQEIDTNLSSPSTGGAGRAPREDPQERLSGINLCIFRQVGRKHFLGEPEESVLLTEKRVHPDAYLNFVLAPLQRKRLSVVSDQTLKKH